METAGLSPHSCHLCQRFILDVRKIKLGNTVRFDITLNEVYQAATNGCTFCRYLMVCDSGDDAVSRLESLQNPKHGALALSAQIRSDGLDIEVVEMFHWRNGRGYEVPLTGFELYAEADDPAARFVRTRPINRTTASEPTFKWARKCLKECSASHLSCRRSSSSFMPKRLIRIERLDGSWKLKLFIPNGPEPYTALSYCGGGDQPMKTTKQQKNRRMKAIPFEVLPNTIRDAVLVTHELGVGLLWIDALCIVQDDEDEVGTEIAHMPEIYEQAAVTIAASRSSSVLDGFLYDREITRKPELVFKLPYVGPDGTLGSIFLFRAANLDVEEPLNLRAWALQERILPLRILDYGIRQTRWICPHTKQMDGYSDGWRIRPKTKESTMIALDHREFSPTAQKALYRFWKRTPLEVEGQIDHWQRMVTAYSRRSLTKSSDRILAISGIAYKYGEIIHDEHPTTCEEKNGVFGQVSHDQYVAGLWKSDIPAGLLWHLESSQVECLRPKMYQGPSWSWTAINSPIEYEEVPKGRSEIYYRLEFIDCAIDLKTKSLHMGQ